MTLRLPSENTGGEEIKSPPAESKQSNHSGHVQIGQKGVDCLLCQNDEMLRLVLEAAELGTWRWEVDQPAKPLIWDARCKALFGLPPDAAITYQVWANFVLPDDLPRGVSILARALDPLDPDDSLAYKYRIQRPDGSMPWMLATGRAYFDPDPTQPAGRRPRRILGTIGDVTETELADLRRIEREKRGSYFLALEEKLRSAETARDAVSAACEALGLELRATFAGVGELQSDGLDTVVESAWSADGDPATLLGRHRFMGAKRIEDLLAGGPVIVSDVLTDPRFAADQGARAHIR